MKGFIIYGRGGHLGHVTQMPQTKNRSPYPRRLHIKFGFDLSAVSEKIFEHCERRRTPARWYTISSPCEPNGSGELIIVGTVPWVVGVEFCYFFSSFGGCLIRIIECMMVLRPRQGDLGSFSDYSCLI